MYVQNVSTFVAQLTIIIYWIKAKTAYIRCVYIWNVKRWYPAVIIPMIWFQIDSKLWTCLQPNVQNQTTYSGYHVKYAEDKHFLFIILLPALIHNWNIEFMVDYALNNIRLQTSVLIIRSVWIKWYWNYWRILVAGHHHELLACSAALHKSTRFKFTEKTPLFDMIVK